MGISFNLPNPSAVKYLDEQFDECIGDEFEQFRLESIKAILVNGLKTGRSYAAVASQIVAGYPEITGRKERSELRKRATLFVLTATGNAYCEASLQQVLNLDAASRKMEKRWVGPEDHRACSGCRFNCAQGWIPVDARFASGHRRPLAHGGCRCCLTFRRRPG